MESPEFGHGVFMNYVLEGLRGQADSDADGNVSLMETYQYARKQTKLYVAHKFNDSQRPGFRGELVDDFNLSQSVARVDPKPLPTAPPPKPPATAGKVITNSIGMKLALIPPGEFLMGSPETELGLGNKHPDREQQHKVRITKPFYVGVYEVTQAEYQAVMAKNPSDFSARGRDKQKVSGLDTSKFPVEMVSWDDANAFCIRLGQKGGEAISLADRSGVGVCVPSRNDGTVFVSHTCNGREANCEGSSPYFNPTPGPYLRRTTRVGSYKPNAFGLYDMHGNVEEWCSDGFDHDY